MTGTSTAGRLREAGERVTRQRLAVADALAAFGRQISAQDLFHTASIVQSRTFRDFEVYIVVAAVYLALALVFRLLFAGLYQLVFARR